MNQPFRILILFFSLLLSMAQMSFAQTEEELVRLNELIETQLDKAEHAGTRALSNDFASKALGLARTSQNTQATCRALLVLAQNEQADKKVLDALKHYIEAVEKARTLDDIKLKNRINLGLASLYMNEQIYNSAADIYADALSLEPKNETIMALIGDAYLAEKLYDSVDVYYTHLIDIYQNRGDYTSEIRYYRKLIDAYSEAKNDRMVMAYYLRIENILERYGTPTEKALLYNNLGKQYLNLGAYQRALDYFKKAELQCQYVDCVAEDAQKVNTAVCLFNLGKTSESIEYLIEAIELLQKKKDYSSLAHAEEMLTGVYLNSNDLYNAQRHNKLTRTYAEMARDRNALARAYERAADIHFELYAYEDAFQFYKQFLTLTDSLRFEDRILIERQSEVKTQLERSEKETKSLLYDQEIKNRILKENALEKDNLEATNKSLSLEARQKQEALLALEEKKKLSDAELKLRSLEALKAQQDLRIAAQQHDAELKERQILDLQQAEERERERQIAHEAEQKQELAILQRDKAISELTVKENENFKKYASLGGGLLLVILGLLTAGYLYSRRANARLNTQNRAIEQQRAQIDIERQRSDNLLLNILPQEVAEELKQTGVATPKLFENVSVLFTDFESFTKLTESAPPELVLQELNTCFHAFDKICEKYDLEKIKTIGDAFMAASGVPIQHADSAYRAAMAGHEMLQFLEERKRADVNVILSRMRVGIHTGQVVAGVVGKNKFAYDIWGDTVNTAARMEEFGESGKVNVSAETAKRLNGHFTLEDRGLLTVHNKGEMRMYFVGAKALEPLNR